MNQKTTQLAWKSMRSPMAKKIGIAFLSLYLLQSNPAYSFGQTIEIHAKAQKLSTVFDQLKRENGYHFFWEGKDFSQSLITVDAKGNIHEVLEQLFSKLPLKYRIQQRTIIVEADPTKKIQQAEYRGRVLNEHGDPIQGASIIFDDGSGQKTTITNAKGQFSFMVRQAPVHVIISSVGYQPQEYSVDNPEKSIFVQLELSNNRMEEVIINTGYQRFNKNNSSGSTAILDSNYFKKRNNNSLETALEGAVPGLSFYKDEKGVSDMRIRGGSSLRAGTQPLMIIDGFASSIIPNINEIENITVLKDAAAAAIWGSQASNGVIVITTKKGKKGKTKVNYSGNLRVQMRPDYTALQRASSAEIIAYEKEQYDKEFVIDIYDGNSAGYTQSIGIFTAYDRKEISLEERDRQLAALAGLNNQDQINKLLLRKAVNQSHFISISGGADKFSHVTTVNGQFDLSGFQQTSSKTFNFNNRLQYDLAKFVSLNTDIRFLYAWNQDGMSGLAGEIRALQPYQMLRDEQGNYIQNYADYNKVENDRLMSLGYRNNGLNLYEENQLANNRSRSLAIRSLFGLDWKIIDGLQLTNNFVYERTTINGRNLYDKDSYATRSFMNRYTVLDKDNSIKTYIPYGDYLDTRSDQTTFLSTRNFLNYIKKLGEKHYFNVLAGFDLNRRINEGDRNRLYGYNDQLLTSQNIDLIGLNVGIKDWEGKTYTYDHSSYVRNNYTENREYSFYGTLAYTYDNRYTVTGSWRNDHSNLFGSDPKFKRTPLWSIGGKWLVDNEHFFNVAWISQLNLRATVGLTGNFDRSNQSSTYLVARRFFNATANDYVARVDSPPNAKLRWERTKTYNVGLDLGILKDRITLNTDYYHKFSYDLLGSQDLDPTVGMSNSYINGADMINKGVEFGLNATILKNSTFQWNSTLNFALNKSKVTKNNITDSDPTNNRPKNTVPFLEGYPRESLWSYRWAGLDEQGRPQTFDAEGNKTRLPVLESLVYNGSSRPLYTGGWSNEFRYKGFQLAIYTVFNWGHYARKEMPEMNSLTWSSSYNNQIARRWQKPGDELSTDIPTFPGWEDLSNEYFFLTTRSSNSIIDAAYLRVRELSLSYTFRREQLQGKLPFSEIRLVSQLNNLWVWKANKSGIDPEALVSAQLDLPQPKVFTFGINVTL